MAVARRVAVQSIKLAGAARAVGPAVHVDAATSNRQYRLKEVDGGIANLIPPHDRGTAPGDDARLGAGWAALHARVRVAAEAGGED